MSLIYYETCVENVECHDCGEKKTCTRITADTPCQETGYVDEIDLCGECFDKRFPSTWD